MTHEPPSEHLDLDRLADLEEDLLTPAETEASNSHLAECDVCRQRQANIRTTRALLSTLPPEPMPAGVANRIDAALSALPSTTIVPLASKRRGWRSHPTAAGLGAAATVAALVAALIIGRTSSHPSSHETGAAAGTAAGAPRTTVPLPTTTVTGTHYTTANLARTVPALLQPTQAATMSQATGAAPVQTPTPEAAGAAAPAAGVPAQLTPLFVSNAALQACVRSIEAGGPLEKPLAIDFATYQGSPSVLIVLPGLEAGKIDAWFMGPDCGSGEQIPLGYISIPTASPTPSPGG